MARCDKCGKEGAEATFFDSGNQVGLVYLCKDRKCIDDHHAYLHRTGFEHIGDSDAYGDWAGRPQHTVHEMGLFRITDEGPGVIIDVLTLGPIRRLITRCLGR